MCRVNDPQRGEVGHRLVDGRRHAGITRHHARHGRLPRRQTAHRDRLRRAATDRERQTGSVVADDGFHRHRHHRLLVRIERQVPQQRSRAGVEPVRLRCGPDPRCARPSIDSIRQPSPPVTGGRSFPARPALTSNTWAKSAATSTLSVQCCGAGEVLWTTTSSRKPPATHRRRVTMARVVRLRPAPRDRPPPPSAASARSRRAPPTAPRGPAPRSVKGGEDRRAPHRAWARSSVRIRR